MRRLLRKMPEFFTEGSKHGNVHANRDTEAEGEMLRPPFILTTQSQVK